MMVGTGREKQSSNQPSNPASGWLRFDFDFLIVSVIYVMVMINIKVIE